MRLRWQHTGEIRFVEVFWQSFHGTQMFPIGSLVDLLIPIGSIVLTLICLIMFTFFHTTLNYVLPVHRNIWRVCENTLKGCRILLNIENLKNSPSYLTPICCHLINRLENGNEASLWEAHLETTKTAKGIQLELELFFFSSKYLNLISWPCLFLMNKVSPLAANRRTTRVQARGALPMLCRKTKPTKQNSP